jgi:hypothetical protein
VPILPGDILTAELLTRDVFKTHVGGTGTIATSPEAVEETFSLVIPADWTSYDINFSVFCRVVETGTAAVGNTNITLRIRSGTTTGGTELGQLQAGLGDAAPDNSQPFSFGASETGGSTTGTRSFVLTSIAGGSTGAFSYQNLRIFAHARRTD